ncbi:unnamed protein product [Rodentolepis nana]|uniref:RAB3GAP2_N domain-containing protein n=1 Tax=Rodentolepis nana TaxID=102285 RepID=A0A0R3T1J1_RODNA|nr:unnamed protein product [Rodentolepis nana]
MTKVISVTFQIFICLKDTGSDEDSFFQNFVYLQRSSSNTERKDLTWTTCADGCKIGGFEGQGCVVIGTRSGSINLFSLPTLDSKLVSIEPSWYFDQCHGKEGVTAVKIIRNSLVITAERRYGRVRRWKIVGGSGDGLGFGLQPLDQILKPSNVPWIGSFSLGPSGEILALGFISFH